MPQNRRSPPSATQDTNQPPIVRPHSATLTLSAFLVGCCDRNSSPPSQRRNPTAAAAILRTCGRPAVRSAGIRTQRVDHPPRDRGSTPRRARAVDPRPYYWPLARPHTATCAVASTPAHRPARRQPTTTTSQPSTSSAAAADLQGNQLGPWSAADIGYTQPTLPGHSSAIPGAPRTHPLPPFPLDQEKPRQIFGLASRSPPLSPYPLAFRRIRWPGIPQLASAGIWRRAERQAPRR